LARVLFPDDTLDLLHLLDLRPIGLLGAVDFRQQLTDSLRALRAGGTTGGDAVGQCAVLGDRLAVNIRRQGARDQVLLDARVDAVAPRTLAGAELVRPERRAGFGAVAVLRGALRDVAAKIRPRRADVARSRAAGRGEERPGRQAEHGGRHIS